MVTPQPPQHSSLAVFVCAWSFICRVPVAIFFFFFGIALNNYWLTLSFSLNCLVYLLAFIANACFLILVTT